MMEIPLIVSDEIKVSECYKYADNILSGKINACKKVKQACSRFMQDLSKVGNNNFQWEFDVHKAYRPVEYIEKFCIPSKGDYKKMEVLPWQCFIEGNLYGWVHKATKLRRFREGIIVVGSGNGKSTIVVGNALYGASKDGERGAEIYTLANSKDQAKIVFGECNAQIDSSPMLKKHFRQTRDCIFFDKSKSIIKALATDSTNLDGLNVHMAVFDELQEYRDYKLINVIKKKQIKRRQPLMIYITTLGTVIDGPLMDYYVLGSNILEGAEAISARASDRTFVYIAEIDECDDPDNIDCWIKANPSLGKLLLLDDLIDEWERNKLIPAQRSDFINKQLNVFTAVDELSFLTPEIIRKNSKVIDMESLKGEACYGGFDLSETEDFTSSCLEFPLSDNDFFVLSHTWVPQKKVMADNEKLDWYNLEKDGLITIVQGDYVDYNLVYKWFIEKSDLYRIDSIGYDPAKAFMLVNLMRAYGFILNDVRQGELTLTAPLDNIKERFLDGNIVHNNNKMLNWYLGNVKLTKRGHNATYLPTRQHKYRKIDGFAALLDSHTEYLRKHPTQISPDKSLTTVIELG